MVYDIQNEESLQEHLDAGKRLVIIAYNSYSNFKIPDYKTIGDAAPELNFLFINLDRVALSSALEEEFVSTSVPCVSLYHSEVLRTEQSPSVDEFQTLVTNFLIA